MKNIVIIGAGDLGKEVVWMIEDINKRKTTYLIMGFLDDDVEKTGNIHYGYEVLGTLDKLPELSEKMDISAVIAIQDGAIRKTIVNHFSEFEAWETIIHPSVNIAATSCVGKGSILFANTIVSVDSILGKFNMCYLASTICNDCKFGDYVSVMSGGLVSEHVDMGEETYLASGVCVYPHTKIGKRVRASVGTTISKDCADDSVINGRGLNLFFK